MKDADNNNDIKSNNIDIKSDNNIIINFGINENQRKANKNFKQKRINIKSSTSQDIFPSDEGLIYVKNKLGNKEDEDIKTVDFVRDKEISENDSISKNENIKITDKEQKKGFFEKNFGWVNYLFNEIPLLWKKEELVKGYDANGNIVYRPKKKIPTKEKNNVDIEKIKTDNEVNYAGLDYTKKGISYGVFFN